MEERVTKEQWLSFLTDFEKTHHGYEAYIEIIGRELGDQEESAWLPLSGISYDPHGDQIVITVGGISSRYPVHLTHMINKPTQLTLRQAGAKGESVIMVMAADATETLVHMRPQPQLPAAGSS